MPLNPAIPCKEPGSLISKGMMAAIVGYKVSEITCGKLDKPSNWRSLSWLPLQLEALEFHICGLKMDYRNCPCLPSLRRLKFEGCYDHNLPDALSPLLPNIEDLELDIHHLNSFVVLELLEAIPKLKWVKLWGNRLVNVQLAPGCQVVCHLR